jgi:ArsR family metal-binding transcriptional regulator
MKFVTTFAQRSEFEKAKTRLDAIGLPYETVSSDPGFAQVGAPALVVETAARAALTTGGPDGFLCAGWVDYHPPRITPPPGPPPMFEGDLFGEASVMVLAPCVADPTKIRIIAHLSGNVTEALPYMNAEMREASYNAKGPTFTFMDQYRVISLYPRRIAIAKADEIVDAWRTLEMIRCRVNDVWSRRTRIEPCYEMREKPPVLEIFKRLPKTNCRACGERTCLAFAVRVQSGELCVSKCLPVFQGDFGHLKDALAEICMGMGVTP